MKNCYMKECIRFLKYIESLNGDYSQYINNDDFIYIIKCCELFYNCEYKCNKYQWMIHLLYLEEISENFEEMIDANVTINRKHEILSDPENLDKLFTLLLGIILPELVSQINKRKNKYTIKK